MPVKIPVIQYNIVLHMQCLELVRYTLPAALEYPSGGLKRFPCVQAC